MFDHDFAAKIGSDGEKVIRAACHGGQWNVKTNLGKCLRRCTGPAISNPTEAMSSSRR
jgi:hypothetical protein